MGGYYLHINTKRYDEILQLSVAAGVASKHGEHRAGFVARVNVRRERVSAIHHRHYRRRFSGRPFIERCGFIF